jgi:hypothetical protein
MCALPSQFPFSSKFLQSNYIQYIPQLSSPHQDRFFSPSFLPSYFPNLLAAHTKVLSISAIASLKLSPSSPSALHCTTTIPGSWLVWSTPAKLHAMSTSWTVTVWRLSSIFSRSSRTFSLSASVFAIAEMVSKRDLSIRRVVWMVWRWFVRRSHVEEYVVEGMIGVQYCGFRVMKVWSGGMQSRIFRGESDMRFYWQRRNR